jgi:uncharacterized iron-regulated protein
MRILLILSLLTLGFSALAEDRVYDTTAQKFITLDEFADKVPSSGQVVLGEYHYQGNIQKAQGTIIKLIVEKHFKQNDFTVAWEFLNYTDQTEVRKNFVAYKLGEISELDLFKKWFPASQKPEQNLPYIAFVNAAVQLGGEVIGVNAPRKQKRVITADGIGALDPDLLPPNYEIGSDNYWKRFVEAMGGHGTPDTMKKYFEAQCFTDSVMAHQMASYGAHDLQFLVVGAFHSDYLDGVVRELGKTHSWDTTAVKVVDKADLEINEYRELLFGNKKYGSYADFIYFTNWK